MPVQGGRIDSISYVGATGVITIDGYLFGSVVQPYSRVYVIKSGEVTETDATINTQTNTRIVATFSPALGSGDYTLYIVTANNESLSQANGVSIISNVTVRTNISIAISLGSF